MNRSITVIICVALAVSGCAKAKPKVAPSIPTRRTLLPQPAKIDNGSGASFVVVPGTVITFDGGAVRPIAIYLAELIGTAAGPGAPAVQAVSEGVHYGPMSPSGTAGIHDRVQNAAPRLKLTDANSL